MTVSTIRVHSNVVMVPLAQALLSDPQSVRYKLTVYGLRLSAPNKITRAWIYAV